MNECAYINREKLEALQGRQTEQQFAKRLGISRVYLHQIKTHKLQPGGKFFRNLLAAYPDANMRELLDDAGE